MALPTSTAKPGARPANPATGGHYVNVRGNWQLIHAVGPGKWAPGPPGTKPATGQKATPIKQKAAPAANPFANPLYQPTQIESGKPLAQATHALTNLQYDPQINQLQRQIQQNTNQGAAAQQATAGYFNTLGQYGQDAANRVNAIGQGLNTTLQGIGQGTQSALDAFGQQAATPALQSLASQGLGGGAAGQLAAVLASQKSLIGQNAAADQSYGAKVGANAADLAAQNLGTYALRGQERIGQIGAATRLAQQPIETQLGTTRANKANAYATNLQSARQQQFNNAVALKGLNIKESDITAANQRAAATITGENARSQASINAANQRNQGNIDARALQGQLDRKSREGIAAANNATRTAIAAGKTSAKAGKPASPAAQRVIWNSITRVQGRLRWLISTIGSWPGATPASAQTQAWHALNSGRLYVPTTKNGKTTWSWQTIPTEGDTGLLNAAFNSLRGGLTPGDVSYLHTAGFTIGNRMPISKVNLPATNVSGLF